MRKLFTLALMMTFAFATYAQSIIFEDDFESYAVGAYIAENSDVWTTWSNAPGGAEDAVASDAFSHSPTKSMHISGTNDMVLPMGNKTSGKYKVSFYVYVENDGSSEGYYNLQHFEAPGTEWALEAYFNIAGAGHLKANGEDIPFTYTQDAWVYVENMVDIDADEAMLYIDGTLVHTWPFATQAGGEAGTPQLGGMNVYAGAEAGTPNFYMDDVVYEAVPATIFFDDFESYDDGAYVALNSDVWTTWSDAPGTAEDAVVSTAFAYSPTKSMHVSGTNDMVLPLGNKTSGQFWVNMYYYIENDGSSEGYFNIQHFEAPGTEWALEVFFLLDGTGTLDANGETITFNYTQGAWVYVQTYVDIDADETMLYIDGTLVHTWPFATQASGGAGTPQLGGVNIYAGSDTGTPNFYVDNVEYLGTSTVAPPTVDVDVSNIISTTGDDEMFHVANVGEQDLFYDIYPVYPNSGKALSPIAQEQLPRTNYIPVSEVQTVVNTSSAKADRDGTLTNVQSEFGGGLGYGAEVTVRAASLFTPAAVGPYIGMEITSVLIGFNDLPKDNVGTLMIWERGSFAAPGPGALVAQKDFTVNEVGEQVLVVLDDPIYLDGNEIWVGYQCTDPGADVFPMGIDAGPRVTGVNWLSTGPGWSEVNPDTDANLFVVCNLTGDGVTQWMSATPNAGTLLGGEQDEITVSFDATGLDAGSTNTAKLMVAANDAANEYTQINVSFIVPATEEYTVTFSVMDEADAPIENATITIHDTELNTDASGMATIDLMDGNYPYTVAAEGYVGAEGEVIVAGAAVSEDVTLIMEIVTYPVTFNVDMREPIAMGDFVVGTDVVYLTGSLTGWTEPGQDGSIMMTDDDGDGYYTAMVDLEAGDYMYKYFKNAGWDGGEWAGDPNREFTLVDAALTLDDLWGGFVGIDELAAQISISPNPAVNYVKITADRNYTVEVIDITGRVVNSAQMSGNQLIVDLSNQQSGMYIVRLTNETATMQYKVVKQ